MIIVDGTIDYDDRAGRDEAVAASAEYQAATRAGEPGCLVYCFAADPVVEDRLQVYELWEDEASLAAHFEHENFFKMREVLGSHGIRAVDANKYRCDLKEPIYDSTGTPRAHFA